VIGPESQRRVEEAIGKGAREGAEASTWA
jgi:hypothetical protein